MKITETLSVKITDIFIDNHVHQEGWFYRFSNGQLTYTALTSVSTYSYIISAF